MDFDEDPERDIPDFCPYCGEHESVYYVEFGVANFFYDDPAVEREVRETMGNLDGPEANEHCNPLHVGEVGTNVVHSPADLAYMVCMECGVRWNAPTSGNANEKN
jgi:hypothetical protein